jgi:hypothetical protein
MKKGDNFCTFNLFADKYILIEEISTEEPIRQEGLFKQRRPLHNNSEPRHRQIPYPTLEDNQPEPDSKEPINQPKK